MITKIKNAGFAGHERVSIPYSKLLESIAETLRKERFIKDIETGTHKGRPVLKLGLFTEKRVPKIKGIERISKPSRRVYTKSSDIRGVKSGYGALILSTSQGIMSGREAKKLSLGGEALFKIW